GTMDISYTNKNSQNHADVSGWAGDLTDLLSSADRVFNDSDEAFFHLTPADTLEGMVSQIKAYIFLKDPCVSDNFGRTDFDGDMDGLYLINQLKQMGEDYETGMMSELFANYFTEELSNETRADYFLKNRLGTSGTRAEIRQAAYDAYTGNSVIVTLEGTRDFLTTPASKLDTLRRACVYAFADYVCELAGDYVEAVENKYFTDFDVRVSQLAPGITQEIHYATTPAGEQMVYYLAIGDLSNEYVSVRANYANVADPGNPKLLDVLSQANATQERYGDPDSSYYIPNYQIVASTNGAGFDMASGAPSGLLVMNGVEHYPINASGFFGITKDGEAVIGTTKEYNEIYKGKLQEGIAGFGSVLIRDGKIVPGLSDDNSNAGRTAVGVTKTGKVVMMVLDGRQIPWSSGGGMQEIAHILLQAGCVEAVNLDGGGSTTFVAKPEGETDLKIINRPSDGVAREVSTSLIMVSTAPSSTAFDHAVLESQYRFSTIGTPVQITPKGVSATGNEAQLPEGYTWAVSDETIATISKDGVFTGLNYGEVTVYMMLDGEILGEKLMTIVDPVQVYFTRSPMSVVQGNTLTLPIVARYEGKAVAINPNDVKLTLNPSKAGSFDGFTFTAAESDVKNVTITAALVKNSSSSQMSVTIFKPGENSFDFEKATGGTRQLAWLREVSNAETEDNSVYTAIDVEKDMVTSYTFAMDMTSIPIPDRLSDLVYMLPGADEPDASAWNFLLRLAERISPLSTVSPTMRFDPKFDVDYSELQIINDYFTLNSVEFNEETNELTMHLSWIDQTQAIDEDTANPLCLVSGIKLTPKDGTFDKEKRVKIVNGGEISYEICMRASSLYSFAMKEENQQIYSIFPYTNPEDSYDQGGKFGSVYEEFEETYTLAYILKEGWVNEGDGYYAYYQNNERLLGMQQIDGLYYDLGTDGLNKGQTKFTGVYNDGKGNLHISQGLQVKGTGWTNELNGSYYHYHEDGYIYKATFKMNTTCIKGGWPTYTCHDCGKVERAKSYAFPNGHTWDANHKCTVCGTVGIDISNFKSGFGTVSKPTGKDPGYYFQKGGVRPSFFVVDPSGKQLTYSNDNNVNDDHTMRDLYISWINDDGIGQAVMNIEGRGNYYGSIALKYHIQPNDVTDLKITAVTETTMTLTWTKPAGADYTRLYLDGTSKYLGKTEGNTYTVTGLTPGEHTIYAATSAYSDNPSENKKVYNCAKWGTVTGWTKASGIKSAEAKGDQVTVAFNGMPEKVDGSWKAYVASYNAEGKMLNVGIASVTGASQVVNLTGAANAAEIRVFVLDSASRPVMAAYTNKK
ncbi:MAG: phosphodiester glycosidase family protein, partial [Clostridia bacterium]|nr:phosphodiester glycosidase family protein [Clostridia bacterium]